VNEIKWNKRFTVVIGNPPYSNFGMLNKNPYILGLLEDYKRGLDDKKINLDDDFIKFVRFSEAQLSTAGVGIHGMITNNAYLDGLTHRRMRQRIQRLFPIVRVANLHGSSKKKEKAPDGTPDENVFDITVGVAIGLLCRAPRAKATQLAYADCWGSREAKTRQLTGEAPIRWLTLNPEPENFFFVPKDFSSGEEYRSGWSVTDVFSVWQNGLKTDRDELFFDFEKVALSQRMRQFYATKLEPQFREKYQVVASSSYDIEARRLATKFAETNMQRCLYRPMDVRWLYYEPNLTSRPAEKVMKHMLGGPNIGLVTTRQTQEKWDVLATHNLCGHKSCAAYDINSLFPLYLYAHSLSFDLGGKNSGSARPLTKRPNFNTGFLKSLAATLQLPQKGEHGLPSGLTPEDIFHYAYAVFHSLTYRSRYAEFLKIDFPRLPLTSSLELFRALGQLGSELVALHLLESPLLDLPLTEFIGSNKEVAKVGYSDGTVWIDASGTKDKSKPGTSGFRGVPEAVWNFHIGGYQVCEKWLKDRKGRTLSADDIRHYHRIVVALSETIRLMTEIDRVIDEHGGWPGAFQASTNAGGQTHVAG
jgi:predicted helicase